MAIVKTIEIDVNGKQAVTNLEEINSTIREQREILVLLEEEYLKAKQALDDFNKSGKKNLAQEKALRDQLLERKRALEDQRLGLKKLTVDQREANEAVRQFRKGQKEQTNIIRGIDKLTGGFATKLVKLGKGFRSGFKASKVFITGLSGVKKALIATGIGAVVILVAALIANFDKIKSLLSGVSSQQKQQLKTQQESVAASEAQFEALNQSENTLRLQGKSEKEIKELKKAQLNDTIAQLEAQLITQKEIKDQQTKAAERNQKILSGIIGFLLAPLKLLTGTVDRIGKAFGKDFGLTEGINNLSKKVAETVFSGVDEEGDQAIKDTEAKLRQLKNTRDGFVLKEREEAKKNAEKKKKEEERQEKELAELKDRIRDAQANREDERRALELEKIREQNKKLLKEAEEQGLRTEELETSLQERLQAKKDEFAQQDLEKKKKEQEERFQELELEKEFDELSFDERRDLLNQREQLLTDDRVITDEQRTNLEKQFSEARKQIDIEEQQAKSRTLGQVGNALGQLSAIAGEETAAGKGLAIASSTINTFRGVSDALAAQTVTPFETALKFINAAAILSSGIKNVKKITAVKVPKVKGSRGGAVASASTGGGSISQPPSFNIVGQTATNQLAEVIGEQTQQPVQAFVVANDVTTAQSLENNIVEGATI